MVTPSVGAVVLVRFPFSDLSASKLRPSVVLAYVEQGDWVLCQVTSNPYGDSKPVPQPGGTKHAKVEASRSRAHFLYSHFFTAP